MEITNRAVDSLIPYSLNNRTHPAEQVARIANSIAEFGFNQPIVVDENNVVLVGHGRLMAAQKLGLKDVPTLKLENLSESKKRAYRILDNKLQNDSEWELDNLKLELQMLEDDGFALEPWGLDSLIPEDETPEVVEDDFEAEEIEDPYIKEGDLIELGEHRVLCGDSTGSEAFAQLMQGSEADAIWTDPPYGVNYVGGTKDPRRKTYRTGGVVHNDDKVGSELVTLVSSALRNVPASGSAVCYVASPAGENVREMIDAFNAAGFTFKHTLVWVKSAFVFGRADYHYQHELVLYGWRDRHEWSGPRNLSTVFEFPRGDKTVEHPTSKPIGLVANTIKNHPARLVVDPFLGSGTTLMACEQLGRKCYGVELSPKYCQVILERYKAYCEKEGRPFVCRINGEPFDGKARS